MNIVPLTLDNIPHAVNLARELHALGTFGREGPEFDWDYCTSTMIAATKDPNYYFRLAQVDDGYVGAVCGKVISFFFSPKVMGLEDAWYVREGTPKRAAIAMILMQGFVNWCMERNAVLVQSGDIAGIQSLGVDALYRHMGFTRFGMIYKYVREA